MLKEFRKFALRGNAVELATSIPLSATRCSACASAVEPQPA